MRCRNCPNGESLCFGEQVPGLCDLFRDGAGARELLRHAAASGIEIRRGKPVVPLGCGECHGRPAIAPVAEGD